MLYSIKLKYLEPRISKNYIIVKLDLNNKTFYIRSQVSRKNRYIFQVH